MRACHGLTGDSFPMGARSGAGGGNRAELVLSAIRPGAAWSEAGDRRSNFAALHARARAGASWGEAGPGQIPGGKISGAGYRMTENLKRQLDLVGYFALRPGVTWHVRLARLWAVDHAAITIPEMQTLCGIATEIYRRQFGARLASSQAEPRQECEPM